VKRVPHAGDIMDRGAIVLVSGTTVREAAAALARGRALHAAVVDPQGAVLGMFSQQGCMRALLDVAYDERPAGFIDGYLEPPAPTVTPTSSLIDVAQAFVHAETVVPTLLVVADGRIVGTVSRLDVIRGILEFTAPAVTVEAATLYISALKTPDERPPL
jgi:CBS domain-containing protein